jgi:hypothetical protein
MVAITKAMQKPDSTLEVRDRMWLKIKISSAFIGSEVVDWLFNNVDGFEVRLALTSQLRFTKEKKSCNVGIRIIQTKTKPGLVLFTFSDIVLNLDQTTKPLSPTDHDLRAGLVCRVLAVRLFFNFTLKKQVQD